MVPSTNIRGNSYHGYRTLKSSGYNRDDSEIDTSTYKAPTVGLGKFLSTFGTTKGAAAFEATKRKIAHHVGAQSWGGTATTSRATDNMTDPVITKPVKPGKSKAGVD